PASLVSLFPFGNSVSLPGVPGRELELSKGIRETREAGRRAREEEAHYLETLFLACSCVCIQAHAVATMCCRERSVLQPSTSWARVGSATSSGGSPGRRDTMR